MGVFAELFKEEDRGVWEEDKEEFLEQAEKVMYYGGMMSMNESTFYGKSICLYGRPKDQGRMYIVIIIISHRASGKAWEFKESTQRYTAARSAGRVSVMLRSRHIFCRDCIRTVPRLLLRTEVSSLTDYISDGLIIYWTRTFRV